jgi:hypothetical protein
MRESRNLRRAGLTLLAAAVVAVLVVAPAIGGLGVISPKQVQRQYLKKKAAGRIYLTKKEAESRFLTKAEADGRFAPKGEAYSRSESDALYLRPEGTIELTAGPSEWVYAGGFGPEPTLSHFSDATALESTDETLSSMLVSPTLPTFLYGRETRLAGVEVCYDAAPNAVLGTVFLSLLEESNGIGAPPPIEELVTDATARTDSACRTYRPQSPVPIGRDKILSLVMLINFNSKSPAKFLIGRTSFTLLP